MKSGPQLAFNHLPAISDALGREIRVVVDKVSVDLMGNAATRAPYETGQLSNSGELSSPSEYEREVTFTAEHAAYQDLGTGDAGAMSSYPWPRDVSYKAGWPGVPATAFLGGPAKEIEPVFVKAVDQAVDRAGRAR